VTDGDDTIDLEGVRRGDAHLSEAKRLHRNQGRTPRPVPLDEIADMAKQTYTTDEVANLLDVDVQTVRRWCREGDMQAADVGRNYRVSRAELSEFWRQIGGGQLFGGDSMKSVVTPEDSPGMMTPVSTGQLGFERAVQDARRKLTTDTGPHRVEIRDSKDPEHPVFEIVFFESDDPIAYRLDWSDIDPNTTRQDIRTEVDIDEVLTQCGLEWPEEGGG